MKGLQSIFASEDTHQMNSGVFMVGSKTSRFSSKIVLSNTFSTSQMSQVLVKLFFFFFTIVTANFGKLLNMCTQDTCKQSTAISIFLSLIVFCFFSVSHQDIPTSAGSPASTQVLDPHCVLPGILHTPIKHFYHLSCERSNPNGQCSEQCCFALITHYFFKSSIFACFMIRSYSFVMQNCADVDSCQCKGCEAQMLPSLLLYHEL